jgi:hypothetical protein
LRAGRGCSCYVSTSCAQAGNPDNSAEKLLHNVLAHSPDSLVNQAQVELALAVRRFLDRMPPARAEKEAEAEH